MGRELSGLCAVEAYYADILLDFVAHNANRLNQVSVLREHDGYIEEIAPSVMDEVSRQIHVGPFPQCSRFAHMPGHPVPALPTAGFFGFVKKSPRWIVTLGTFSGPAGTSTVVWVDRVDLATHRCGEIADELNFVVSVGEHATNGLISPGAGRRADRIRIAFGL
jgi:hypothetical protein